MRYFMKFENNTSKLQFSHCQQYYSGSSGKIMNKSLPPKNQSCTGGRGGTTGMGGANPVGSARGQEEHPVD